MDSSHIVWASPIQALSLLSYCSPVRAIQQLRLGQVCRCWRPAVLGSSGPPLQHREASKCDAEHSELCLPGLAKDKCITVLSVSESS